MKQGLDGNSCSTSLRSPEPQSVSALSGNDQGREDRLVSVIALALRQYLRDQAPSRQKLQAHIFINNRDDEMARAVLAAITEATNGNEA